MSEQNAHWWHAPPMANSENHRQEAGIMDDERLTGLIAYLLAYHGGGFVNNTIQRDELLSVLQELKAARATIMHASPNYARRPVVTEVQRRSLCVWPGGHGF